MAITALLALVLAATSLAWRQERQLSAVIERLASVDLQRIERLSATFGKVNDHANSAARHLTELLATPRSQRSQAYSQIDSTHQLLERAIADLTDLADLAGTVEADASKQSLRTIQTLLARYRQAYQQSANLIEADELAAAHKNVTEVSGLALAHLIKASQAVSQAELQKTSRSMADMAAQLKQQRAWLLAWASAGLVLAGALCAWVLRSVARPLHHVATVARRMAAGDYQERLPEAENARRQPAGHRAGPGGSDGNEVQAIGAAFNQMATRMQEREQALQQALDFDTLTGLSRRERFIADQGQAALASASSGQRLALLCFDIERLKSINALLGFEAGDEAIVATAQRALRLVGQRCELARLGGGTFGAALTLQPGDSALARAQAFQSAMEQAASWRGHTLDLGVAVGVAAAPEHGETPQELLRRAEQALFEAKRTRSAVGSYNPGIEAARLSHLSLLSELQQAMDRHELVPFLQPKWCTRTQRVVGAEALVRWQHPQRGWVAPAEFIPFAERTGRIAAVTRYMLRACIAILQTELRSESGDLHLAVNISTVDLRDPQFVHHVQQLLEQAQLAPERLLLEVTESGLLDSGEDPVARLAAVRALGVGVAIDDFGTGQSSLAYLQRLPATELKIDRSFVTDADSSAGRQQLLRSIVDMAHSLGLVVTAEGIETEAERQVLTDVGCDLLQGYLIGKPMPVADFVRRYVASAETTSPPVPEQETGRSTSSA